MAGRSQSIGTVIVAQRALFREGVAALLRHTPYKVIATAQRPSELKDVTHSASRPRMLIILGMDDNNGSVWEIEENVRSLRSLFPDSTIVVIAETHSAANVQQILMAAPNGYVANLSSRDVLLRLLEVAFLDQQVIVLSRPTNSKFSIDENEPSKRSNSGSETTDLQLPKGGREPQLSKRERQILIRLAEGDSNKQIARICNITESTVKVHLKAILRKITVHNRTQAAIWAITKGYHVKPESNDHIQKQTHGAAGRSSIDAKSPVS